MKAKLFILSIAIMLSLGGSSASANIDDSDCYKNFIQKKFKEAIGNCRKLTKEDTGGKAEYILGILVLGIEENGPDAVKWFRKSAEQGYPSAQGLLGDVYFKGRGGIKIDYEKAVKWWKLAANQGNAQAQFHLGAVYADGKGVPEDDRKAVKWYRMAAEQGYADAQYDLGVMYALGEGVVKDTAESTRWYKLAAEQGNKNAQYNLGLRYYLGNSVRKNYRKAFEWFYKSAIQGDVDSQFSLGVLYYNGDGVERDYTESYIWFSLADKNGHEKASKNRDDISDISSEELAYANREATRRYNEYKEKPIFSSPNELFY